LFVFCPYDFYIIYHFSILIAWEIWSGKWNGKW